MPLIVLLQSDPNHGWKTVFAVLRFLIADPARRVPKPAITDSLAGASFTTPSLLADLQSGAVREERIAVQLPLTFTPTEIEQVVARWYADRAQYVALDVLTPSPQEVFGRVFDGSIWS